MCLCLHALSTKSLLFPSQRPSSPPWCSASPENEEQSPGLRAKRPIRHAGRHAAPGHWWRIGWGIGWGIEWRIGWRWRWNQTPSRNPPLRLQPGFIRLRQGVQRQLGEPGQPRHPCLGPTLHHAAGQRRAQVCRCASTTQRSVQLQR